MESIPKFKYTCAVLGMVHRCVNGCVPIDLVVLFQDDSCSYVKHKSPEVIRTCIHLHSVEWVAIDCYYCGRGLKLQLVSGVDLPLGL